MKGPNGYDVLLKVVEVLEKKISYDHALLTKENKATIKISISKIDSIISNNEVYMGDKINVDNSQVGSIGKKSNSEGHIFNQANYSYSDLDFKKLNEQLTLLRNNLVPEAKDTGHFKALGEIAQAEEAAGKNDGQSVANHLVTAGKWAFDKAQEIGTDIVTDIIKKQMGL